MAADSVFSIAWDVFTIVFVPIKHRFEYVMCSKRYADGLRKELGNLEYEADRVRRGAERARRNLEDTEKWVDKFLESSEKALKEAGDLSGEFENMSKTCCRGTLPDPICHYRFSRKAKHTTDYIKNLILDIGGKEISAGRPAPGDVAARREGKDVVQSTTVTASTSSTSTSIKLRDDGIFESRASVMQKIMNALADDTKSMVGVHGMGGVGKSTLLVDVERILCKKKSFDWVAKADVSQNPDIKMIQKEIAHCLDLSEMKQEEDVKLRAKLLLQRLEDEERNKRKVLIMLDDLWDQLDLKQVGIPCGHNNRVKGCKLLMTARDQNVLLRKMLCDAAFPLGFMKDDEAKRLFMATVGGKVRAELELLMEKALGICGGLPFLILAIAKLFINTTYSECENALNEILNEETGDLIDNTLRVSYNRIKREEQSLLRLCAVYDIPNPSLEDLVRYGVGLGLFGSDRSMQDAREMLGRLIRTLQASSLLLHNGKDDGFKIHDLVRIFVTSIVSRDHPLLVLKEESVAELWKHKTRSCEALCFPYVNLEELPKQLDCPDLKIFMLFTNNSLEVPDSYFNSMKNLMVLDLVGIRLIRSPSPFQSLEKLHTLCLGDCSLENMAILGELKELQILSIRSSSLCQLPQEIRQLTELRLLDLNGCSKLQKIEPDVLGSLTKLEELYMENNFVNWNAMDQMPPTNASLKELNNMKNLYTLYISIPDPSVLPKDLNFKRLTKYRIQIGKQRHWRSCKGSSTLELQLDPKSVVLQKGCIQSILGKTDDLFLKDLNGNEQSICMLSQKGFPELKHLEVVESPSVHYILQSSSHADFEKLESLLLNKLIKLEKICYGHISSKSFGALKVVRVKSCDRMKVLFPLSVVRGLSQLEEIVVYDCKSMCGIVEVDDRGKSELPKLRVLKLYDLPNIKSFFTDGAASSSRTSNDQVGTPVSFFNGQQVSIPSLESLRMHGLPNLKEIWSDESPLELSNLQSIEVVRCRSLLKVISFRSLMNLRKLRTLTIESCVSLQEIFYLEGPSFSGNYTTLSKLNTFPLEKLVVEGSNNLRFMFLPSVVKSLAQLRDILVLRCKNMEAIIMEEERLGLETPETLALPMLTNLHLEQLESLICFSHRKSSREAHSHNLVQSCSSALFNREVSIPSLESLMMEGIPNVKEIWSDESLLELSNLQSIKIVRCRYLSKVISFRSLMNLQKLRTLTVESCISVQEIFYLEGPSDGGNYTTPSELTTFPLEKLVVDDCNNLRFIFFPSMVKSLAQLKDIKVLWCKKMEAIIKEEERPGLETSETLALPMLTNLRLEQLESLICFSHGKSSREAHSHNLVQSCSAALFNREVAFPRLETLEIIGLDNLRFIFSPSMVKSLAQLRELTITKCNKMEAVITEEEGLGLQIAETPASSMESEVAFHQLKNIKLDELRELRCFSSGGYDLMFPLLEDIVVDGCPKMNLFSKGLIKVPNLERVQAFSREYSESPKLHNFWEGNLNAAIENIFEEMGTFASVKEIRLFEIPEMVGKWHSELNPIKSYWQLRSLFVDKCSFVNAIPPKLMLVLDNLSTLQVYNCELLEEIFNLEGLEVMENTRVLPKLETLTLRYLSKLRQLWNKDLQGMLQFNSLTCLILYKCSNLRHAFAPSMVQCIASLEWMEIKECGQMEKVIAEDEGQGSAVEKITFAKLQWIILECLPSLTSFLSGKDHMLECPNLKMLAIDHCPRMRSLTSGPSLFTSQAHFPQLDMMVLSHMDNLSKIWIDNLEETLTFDKLTRVEVQNCKSLENLFPYRVATSLNQLKELRLESCGIEEIVANGDDSSQSNAAQVLFPKLTSLVLHDMSRLKSFYPDLLTLSWPLVDELRVTHCDKLDKSFAASMNNCTQRDDSWYPSDQDEHSSFERANLPHCPNLERLLLFEKDIQMIEDGKFHNDIFGKPKAVTLACFHDENTIFPPRSFLGRFQNLQSLEVFCSSFEDIFPNEELVDVGKHLVLESLKELKLNKLHNLKRIWREDYLVSKILQSLQTFEVWDCPGLTTLFPTVTSFQNLTKLVVKNSSGLVHLVTVSAVTNLVHLTEMKIIGCERMKKVVESDENGEGKMISFGKLEYLILQQLSSLECFSSTTSCSFEFPSLLVVLVEECPKMKIFSKGMLITPKLKSARLFGLLCKGNWEGDLNAAIQKLAP